jgi:flagellar biosynthetic protein FliR
VTELTPVARIALLLLRPGMLVVVAPAFGSSFAPPSVKVGIVLLISISLMPIVALPSTSLEPAAIALIALRETIIGFALALSVRIVVSAAELAGHLAGFQLGFAYASLVDPQSGARNTVMSALYGSLALFIFFSINAHHEMLRALGASYEALPIGVGAISSSLGPLVAKVLGMMFSVGLQLAAPVVFVLLVVELALGLMARAMPALNLMTTAAPIRLLVGMAVLVATMDLLPTVVRSSVLPALDLAARLAAALR